MSNPVQETTSPEVRCWGAELIWDQVGAEMAARAQPRGGQGCGTIPAELLEGYSVLDATRQRELLALLNELLEEQRAVKRAQWATA